MSESITSVKPEDPTPTLTSPREVKGLSPSSTPRPGQGYWAMVSGQFPSTVLYPGMTAFSIGLPIIMYFMFGTFQNYSTEIMGRGNVAAMVMFQLGSWGAFLAAASMGAAVGIERTAGWTRQLSLTPATSLTYFAVKVTLAVCSAALSIVVLLAVGAIFNARAEWWVWIAVPLTTLACCIVPAIMGLAIGYMVRSDAAYGIIGGGSAILGFLSGTFMQVESMPKFFQTIAPYTPLYGMTHLSSYPLYNEMSPVSGLMDTDFNWGWVVSSAVWAIISAIAALWRIRRSRNR